MQVSKNLLKILMLIALHATRNTTYRVEVINPTPTDVLREGYLDDIRYLTITTTGARICGINDHKVYTAGNGTWGYTEFYDNPELPPTFEYGELTVNGNSLQFTYTVGGLPVLELTRDPVNKTLRVEFFV